MQTLCNNVCIKLQPDMKCRLALVPTQLGLWDMHGLPHSRNGFGTNKVMMQWRAFQVCVFWTLQKHAKTLYNLTQLPTSSRRMASLRPSWAPVPVQEQQLRAAGRSAVNSKWSDLGFQGLPATVDGRNAAPPWMVETCWNPINHGLNMVK